MSQMTINTQRAIEFFHNLMAPSNHMKVLCLRGDGKMGKTHLLTKVFPDLAQDYHARYALLDLRNPIDSIPDILHSVCAQLAPHACDDYYRAHDRWASQSGVHLERIISFFTTINIRSIEDARSRNRHLTMQFIRDLNRFNANPLLLLFDSVERADEGKQNWLAGMLLTHLRPYSHIKVVLAGRSLPEVHPSYAVACDSLNLSTIEDDQAYITYYNAIKATLKIPLEDQTIPAIARLCGNIPGIFAEFVAGG